MNLSIIIVSWNVKEKLKQNLTALYKSAGDFSFEVFVVDNNSSDASAEMVKNEFPQVKLIANSNNLGFARANNQALKLAQGDFILLLNPDMQVFPDTLVSALDWMKNNNQATVAGCHLINAQKKTIKQVRRFPKFFDQLMIVLKVPHVFPVVLNKYLCQDFNYEQAAKVDSIRGSFFLINKNNFRKISNGQELLLDERYFIWFEEVDFCRLVYKLGGEVWYAPGAECLDYVGQSFSQVSLGKTQNYFKDSMLKYFKKWEPRWQSCLLKLAWIFSNIIIKIFVSNKIKTRP